MVLREVERRPGRAALSALGISFAAAILVAGRFSFDSLDVVLDLQFTRAQSDDVTVSFSRPLPLRAALEIARLPGVMASEPQRMAGVRLRAGRARARGGASWASPRSRLSAARVRRARPALGAPDRRDAHGPHARPGARPPRG